MMYMNIEYMTLTIYTIILFVTIYSILERNYLNQVPCGWFSRGQSKTKTNKQKNSKYKFIVLTNYQSRPTQKIIIFKYIKVTFGSI